MTDPIADYVKLAEDLLLRARKFDWADVDNPVEDGGNIRTEVLRDFVELWLEQKISEDKAAEINRLTSKPYILTPALIATALERLFKDRI